MSFKMFNFKNFFVNNHNTDFILEARRGDTPESSVLIDEEDLDFLYQIDYTYWTNAISTRYEVLLDELKKRGGVREKIEAIFVKQFKNLYKTKEDRENISLDSFVDFVNNFASNFNDYGEKVSTPVADKVKFKNWEKDFREEYGEDFDKVKKAAARSFLHELRFMICGYIVPFVKEKKAYPLSGVRGRSRIFVPMYINRLIQKLETTKGEEITLPENSHKLLNISRILAKDVPIEMKKTGSYGFDLDRARIQNIPLGSKRSTVLGKTRGFTFPSLDGSKSIKNLIRQLAKFNYQRHMGPLPSDENFKRFSGVDEDGNPILTYKFWGVRGYVEDSFNYDVIKNSIKNKIVEFIANNRNLLSWSKVKDHGLFDIIDSKFQNEIESGSWAASSSKTINFILKNKSSLVNTGGDDRDKVGMAKAYVSNWQNISGNRTILDEFAEHFAEKQTDHLLESGKKVMGPRILDGETEEERKSNFLRLDANDRKELEKKLSADELDEFIKTGRLPLNLKTIGGRKKLVPGDMNYAPVVLPFIKTKVINANGDEQQITVPLLKPGMYLSGLSGGGEDEEEEDQEEKGEEDFENQDELDTKDSFTTPSTSDRTSIYKVSDENGEEKEVKVISAKSSERYFKKKGVGGVYYSIDTKGETRKFGFNRWKRSDKLAFIRVWSHPDHSEQVFSRGDVVNKYSQLFGRDIMDIYDNIDSMQFYSKQDLPDYYPFILNGWKIGKENDIPRKSAVDTNISSDQGYSNRDLDSLNKKIIKSNSSPEIMGFPLVIKSINDCLSMKKTVCNNDGNHGFRDWLLENPQRIQDLHDYVVKEVIEGDNRGIWKTFLGEFGEKKGAIDVFCSIIGKWQQKRSDTLKGSFNHGQIGRKSRKNLIGSLSIAAFRRDLSAYQDYLDSLEKKSKQSKNFKGIRSIESIKVIGDDSDDEIVEWFYPGYGESENKGGFQADKDNFKPDIDNWRLGPPTDLRNFLRNFYESDKKINQEQKDILLSKIKEEKKFLVGQGSIEDGVIGTDSYIFNQSIFDETPEDSTLTVKQQIQALHDYTNKIYDKDIEYVSKIKVYEKEAEEPREDEADDESDPYIKDFKQKFNEILPLLRGLLQKLKDVNNFEVVDQEASKAIDLISKFQTSTQSFVAICDVLYRILGNPQENKKSLLEFYSLFLKNLNTETSEAEITYIRKNPGSNTRSFFIALNSVSDMFLSVAIKFENIIESVLNKYRQDENYRRSVGSFIGLIRSNNLMPEKVRGFLNSNLSKQAGSSSPQGKLPYFDPIPRIQELQAITSSLIRRYGSTLRKIDMSDLSSDPNFLNVGKIKRVEIINIINSKKDIAEKSSIAKRVKDYYIKSGQWDSLDSYFRNFIDKNIV